MISGIGCDLCEIARIKNAGEAFLERCFTEKERALFEKKYRPYEAAAANFAAKESFSKALGTGMRGFSFADIEVLRDELGKPYINLYDGANDACKEAGITKIHVSLSHTDSLAMAYVILEGEN